MISCSFRRISSPFDRSKLQTTKASGIIVNSKLVYALISSILVFFGMKLFYFTDLRSGPTFYSYYESYSVVQSRSTDGKIKLNVDRTSNFQTNVKDTVDFSPGDFFDRESTSEFATDSLTEPWWF